jgi:triacylglycerol esterase/lipase EstA (alpha/beta hydrolase family)
MNEPIVLVGGYRSHWRYYQSFGRSLARVSGRRVFITSIQPITWMIARYIDSALMVTRTSQAVQYALAQTGAQKVILVGHSAGGVIARAYLADRLMKQAPTVYNGYRYVSRVITLGSPLKAVDGAQHPELRLAAWLDQEFPGAYYAPEIQYLSVYGKLIEGRRFGTPMQRRAYAYYHYLSGTGGQWGDGVVPSALSQVDGIPSLELNDVGHSPLWGTRWYGGDESIIRSWWSYFDQADAPLIDAERVLA